MWTYIKRSVEVVVEREKNTAPEISVVTVIDTLELALFPFLIISPCEALRMLFST